MQQGGPGAQDGDKLHHEDVVVGGPFTFGHKVVTAEEIIAYGRAYDPQPMHTDPEAAKATPVGGLCASGWHTCAMMMRMMVDNVLGPSASLGSPGVDEGRWRRPVRPGDTLSISYTVHEKRVLASRPDVGIARVQVDAVDANGEVLCSWHSNQLTRVRHPTPAPAGAKPRTPQPKKAPALDLWDTPAVPRGADAFFEDAELGETWEIGSHTFTREEIMAFAREFDPQPFHLDEAAAQASLFGGLCASGWHTAALFIRFIITSRHEANGKARAGGAGLPVYGPSPGFRDLNWPKPVLAGDTVTYRTRMIEKIDMRTRPSRGLLASAVQGRNQRGELVFSVTSLILADRRQPLRG